MDFAGFEYGLWGIGCGGSPIRYEGSLRSFKFKATLLLFIHEFCRLPQIILLYSSYTLGLLPLPVGVENTD